MTNQLNIDPVAIDLGIVQIYWYGIMYLLGFAASYLLGTLRAKRSNGAWNPEEIPDVIFYAALGVIVGGRLGYVVFYSLPYYFANPLELLYIWEGGMSFHGGLIGVSVAIYMYARKTDRHFLVVSDFIAPLVPLGLLAGRIGNFINQELWGKVTDLPWGVIFSTGGPLPRHPSQLYEAFLEGLLLFLLLWIYSSKSRSPGIISGLFLLGYSIFRILVEFVRVPDLHIGYIAFNWLTVGQLLSLPLAALGIYLIIRGLSRTT